jgi:lysophospholipase L1-like esterase
VNTGGTFVAIGGAGTGGSTSATYRPCPTNGDPCKILPLGDSITWGLQYDGAYRVELFSKTVAAKQNITFTGSLSNGPAKVSNVTFPKSNEGHSGWTIAQISNQVPSPAFNTIPHIVLLLIGTNDVYASSGQATMPDRLGSLMDKIITAAPNALLVVAKITPLGTASFNATIKTYNDAIPELVQSRVAAGKHVMLADMNTGFTASMLSTDQVHPNQSGYDFMGDKWYELIGELLPQ